MGKVSILELSYKDVDSIVHNISLTPAVKILESSDCCKLLKYSFILLRFLSIRYHLFMSSSTSEKLLVLDSAV